MQTRVILNYYHPAYNIGMENIRIAWLLKPGQPIQLKTIVHQGNLYYRLPGTGKRISYQSLKTQLIKKKIIIPVPVFISAF